MSEPLSAAALASVAGRLAGAPHSGVYINMHPQAVVDMTVLLAEADRLRALLDFRDRQLHDHCLDVDATICQRCFDEGRRAGQREAEKRGGGGAYDLDDEPSLDADLDDMLDSPSYD